MRKNALVLAGSKGVGKAIRLELENLGLEVEFTSRSKLDTSKIENVQSFIENQRPVDILVLNTGGPPAMNFSEISIEDWKHYFNQLFLSFVLFLQADLVKENGYVVLISSCLIKEPEQRLMLSSSFRTAFSSILKTYSNLSGQKNISCINLALGPIKTERLVDLVPDMEDFEKTLPMNRAGNPEEVGKFIAGIITNDVKYLNGATINFDGGLSRHIF